MPKKRCSFVEKGKKACHNTAIEGFAFCKSHIYRIESLFKYRVPNHILLEKSGNAQGFIFDSKLGHVYHLNASGLLMFSLMKEDKSLSEIAKKVSKQYGIDTERVVSDFRDFYNNLKHLGLIVADEEH